ncbi:hypothetical protein B7P43_G00723 [Cryptotermes secundus]|uniref:EMI domain-containing protein n=2 Tax=Cryptotermes secundus TaxID=105785 RepID=A0A2J7QUA9_9NEOP|nr:hypothetical protein B7P43_G00723 [Cryptotermes secundus]PNF32169.1 hypothetical protein B7P43_G00723 [Cryptotermes secundus]
MHNEAAAMTPLALATLLLAVGTVLSVAELTGENVCHKRETYTVTLRVTVKEPVHVKTYTWCLKVPPRCTKYKVEMRDRIKIQTEVRERVVDVCCAGYALDWTETQCLPVCKGCLHGVCATPDTCSCEPGYTGDRCDIECPEGLWGPACGLQCQCRNAATCNHISGDCKCTDGWRGSLCDVTCPKGTYGHACLKECNCETGDSDESAICDHVTGDCRLGEARREDHESNRHITAPPEIHTTARPAVTQTADAKENEAKDSAYTAKIFQQTGHSAPQTLENTDKRIHFTDERALTSTITSMPSFLADMGAKTEIPEEVHNSSLGSITSLPDHQSDDVDVSEQVEEPETIKLEDTDRPIEEPGTTVTENANQNVRPARRPIIVVSDGLLSGRMEEDGNEGTGSGVWNLVSSASVAGGVALTLIIMATVTTVLVSHRRNKAKMAVAENEMASVRKQQQATSGPRAYNYTQDVTTLPLRHVFPDTDIRADDMPRTDGLQLSFGDVSSTMTTHNSFGHPCNSYNNARAYLELQYDIPPSCTSSNSNSLRPGMEPEHLYDEIPWWRSTRNTDTSRC